MRVLPKIRSKTLTLPKRRMLKAERWRRRRWKWILMMSRRSDEIIAVHLIRWRLRGLMMMILWHWRWHRQRSARMFPEPCASITKPNLNPCFSQTRSLREFFACVNVRILSSCERLFQSLQLITRKCRARSSLFSLQQNSRLTFSVRIAWAAACFKRKFKFVWLWLIMQSTFSVPQLNQFSNEKSPKTSFNLSWEGKKQKTLKS